MDLKNLEFPEVLSSLKCCGSDLHIVFPKGFVPSPACSKTDLQASGIAWISERKRIIKDKCRHVCIQSHLKTPPALLSIWNHMSFPFITISALAGFGWLPNCHCCQKSKTSVGWFIWCLDSSGAGLRSNPKNQIPRWRPPASPCSRSH